MRVAQPRGRQDGTRKEHRKRGEEGQHVEEMGIGMAGRNGRVGTGRWRGQERGSGWGRGRGRAGQGRAGRDFST